MAEAATARAIEVTPWERGLTGQKKTVTPGKAASQAHTAAAWCLGELAVEGGSKRKRVRRVSQVHMVSSCC